MPSDYLTRFFDAEIRSARTDVASVRRDLRWFAQVYGVMLVGSVTLMSYLRTGNDKTTSSLIGCALVIAVFFFGFYLLAIAGQRIASRLMAQKHLAMMRGERMKLVYPECETKYVFSIDPAQMKLHGSERAVANRFALVNYAMLCGGLAICISQIKTREQTVCWVVAIATTMAATFPRICASFNMHLAAASQAANYAQLMKIRAKYARRKRESKLGRIIEHTVLGLIAAFSWHILIPGHWWLWDSTLQIQHLDVVLSLSAGLFCVLLRVYMEGMLSDYIIGEHKPRPDLKRILILRRFIRNARPWIADCRLLGRRRILELWHRLRLRKTGMDQRSSIQDLPRR